MTFEELVKIEPRLEELFDEAKKVSSEGNPNFCANAVWYGTYAEAGLKDRLVKLVGWEAEKNDKTLRSGKAYDLAYKTIYDALPYCRHAGGIC
jgi:hypothetical protein